MTTAKAPVGGKRPFRMVAGISRVEDLANYSEMTHAEMLGVKTVYYVESNAGNDGNDGLTWDSAYKTLAVAMAASHADIAVNSRGWASRNVILYKGDANSESLVKFAQKTTVIGVGSTDGNGPARIVGLHVPVNAGAYGCHFVNLR